MHSSCFVGCEDVPDLHYSKNNSEKKKLITVEITPLHFYIASIVAVILN
jgi:hypothetical protein